MFSGPYDVEDEPELEDSESSPKSIARINSKSHVDTGLVKKGVPGNRHVRSLGLAAETAKPPLVHVERRCLDHRENAIDVKEETCGEIAEEGGRMDDERRPGDDEDTGWRARGARL